MKTILPSSQLKTTNLLIALFVTFAGFTQTVPEMVFKNPVLISGTAGQNGAKYRFSNVTTGANALDVIVEIRGRSANDVVLKSIDSTGLGWDKAFQPALGIPNVGANREWWMEFRMQFVYAGTTNARNLDTFYVTGIDIDGDGNHLNEWAEMKKAKQLQLAPTTSLLSNVMATAVDLVNSDNDGTDFRVNGPTTNYGSIDTGSTAVMATTKYVSKDKIDFRLGGKTNATGGSSGNTGIRLNSLWFKQFTLTQMTLPLSLIDFNATLNKSKVDLKWTTVDERNVSHFEIEKSTDGVNYSQEGLVFAYGNTTEKKNYSFSDDIANVQSNIVYYRLRSLDIDGKSQLSQIRVIRISKQNAEISLITYPNPTSSELRVTVPAVWQNKEVAIEVYNTNGQRVKAVRTASMSQTETISVRELSNGIYIIKASCGSEAAQQKFIKN